MPTITLNKKVFEQLVGKELPLQELKDRISMLGTDLEKIENEEIHVEIFPNRPDLLSEQGFARAFSSFIGIKTGLKEYNVQESGQKVVIEKSVQGIRPYTVCAIVKGLQFNEEKIREVIQIQEKLHVTYGRNRKKVAIGVYPLEKISFPVRYKADSPDKIVFQPLETEKEMNGLQILSQHKTGQEYGYLLEGLEKFPFFIDAKDNILSMPPIINSHLTGRITEETKDVFIECSGHEFEVLSKCLNMIVTSLEEMGGEIYSVKLEYENGHDENEKKKENEKVTPNLIPARMKLDFDYVNKILGLELKKEEAVKLLSKMGYGFDEEVLIPPYRADILHQIDLVEDIAIAYGYENFEEKIPNVATIGEENSFEKFSNKVREILAGLKLLEVKNYHLVAEDLMQKMKDDKKLIYLKNSLGEHNRLRNSLLPSLIKTLQENQHNEYPQNIFEIGKAFIKYEKEDTGVKEINNLGISLCHEKTDFTEVRQILEALLSSLGVKGKVKEVNNTSFIMGRVGEVIVNDKKIGLIGEIHPEVLNNWDLTMPVVGLELNLDDLFELVK